MRGLPSLVNHIHKLVPSHLYPLPFQQSQEALQCAAAWVYDELSQSADEQGGICAFRAMNKN